jgi:hypothetical protein
MSLDNGFFEVFGCSKFEVTLIEMLSSSTSLAVDGFIGDS